MKTSPRLRSAAGVPLAATLHHATLLAGMVALLAACAETGARALGSENMTFVGEGDLAQLLEPIRVNSGSPAMAAAVVTTERVTHAGVAGYRKKGDATPARLADPFHLGSNTKAMTATLIGWLVDRGKLSWTTTLATAFPEWASEIHPALRDVTVDDLLAHRAGLAHDNWPPGGDFGDNRRLRGTPAEQRLAYAHTALTQAPEQARGTFGYSNTGYTLLGVIAERAAGTSWEELMRRVLFEPLEMNGAGFGPMGHAGAVDAPWQHSLDRGRLVPVEPGHLLSDNPVAIGPSGNVHVPITGWAGFVMDQLRGFEGRSAVLSPASFTHLHTPLFGGDYVGGWSVTSRPWGGGTVYTHTGSNTMNAAVVWMAPSKKFAVLVTTNRAGDEAFKACDRAAGLLIKQATREM